jgi:hypothetical protein
MQVTLSEHFREHAANNGSHRDDETAELIAALTEREADLLWAALIQLKPHLRD